MEFTSCETKKKPNISDEPNKCIEIFVQNKYLK